MPTLTRRLLWPLAILLLVVCRPAAAAGNELFYLGQRIPDIQRTWTSEDYQQLIDALKKIEETQANSLPRRSGEFTGPTQPRLARQTGAVVVAPAYRLAPEHKFPAAHEDAYAAWLWMIENAETLGGDAARAAVFGEDAGANMALNIALQARDEAMQAPVHSVLVTPIAGTDVTRPSHIENARARPLGTALLQWYFRHAFANKADAADPRIGLAQREDFAGINPVTLILADIDPVRSEGEALALKLNEADVWVDAKVYEGVSHDFFALGRVVNKARFAQAQALTNLNEALKASRRSPGLA